MEVLKFQAEIIFIEKWVGTTEFVNRAALT